VRRYESVVILAPEMPDDDIRNFTEKYSELIKTNGGEIIKIEDWGFKRLAYLVKKKEKGRYILFDFVGVPAVITELERQFKISEEVLKFLSVKIDDDVDLEAFKAAEEEKKAAEAARRAPPPPAPAEPAAPAAAEEVPEPAAEEAAPPPEAEEAPATVEAEAKEPAAAEEKKEGE
jgi:small subunit ribosomal protein S6